MFEFKILKNSKKSKARIGILRTEHGEIETPSLVVVATQASVKTLDKKEILETKSKILICNTFFLHLRPGEKIIKKAGGLHKFMNWEGILITDSGGFQVFSWGFKKDLGGGKILKTFGEEIREKIEFGQQPKLLKIMEEGVYFKSPLDGKEVFLGPKESIKIQEDLGADIIFSFDECTSPFAKREYIEKAVERNCYWAELSLLAKKSKQAIFGIVHGSKFKDLREKSAKFIASLPFDGFGIGGDLGEKKETMFKILNWVLPHLPKEKPRHLLGIGYLEDIPEIIKRGIDLFDCAVPTLFARHGIAFTSRGKLDLKKSKFLQDKNPIDKGCNCFVCYEYKRNYICHLFRAKEILGMKLLTFHNLYFFNTFVEKIREKIKKGKI